MQPAKEALQGGGLGSHCMPSLECGFGFMRVEFRV